MIDSDGPVIAFKAVTVVHDCRYQLWMKIDRNSPCVGHRQLDALRQAKITANFFKKDILSYSSLECVIRLSHTRPGYSKPSQH